MKRLLKIVGIILVVLIVVVIAIPFLIDANTFKPRLESELTGALGRQVTVGNLTLSLMSGSVGADNISIADDPQFSKSPFVQAKSLKVGVEMIPLIFSKTLNVTELTLNEPEISLVKSENGEKWNFSSLGGNNTSAPKSPAQSAPGRAGSIFDPRSAGREQQSKSIGRETQCDEWTPYRFAGRSKAKPRVYDKVNVEVNNFSFASSFPFEMSADLPAGGSMKLTAMLDRLTRTTPPSLLSIRKSPSKR